MWCNIKFSKITFLTFLQFYHFFYRHHINSIKAPKRQSLNFQLDEFTHISVLNLLTSVRNSHHCKISALPCNTNGSAAFTFWKTLMLVRCKFRELSPTGQNELCEVDFMVHMAVLGYRGTLLQCKGTCSQTHRNCALHDSTTMWIPLTACLVLTSFTTTTQAATL